MSLAGLELQSEPGVCGSSIMDVVLQAPAKRQQVFPSIYPCKSSVIRDQSIKFFDLEYPKYIQGK